MKKKFLVINAEEESVDFVIKQTEDTITLKRSKGEQWTKPNEKVFSLHNHGNGVKLSNGMKFDYSEMRDLFLVLAHYYETSNYPIKHTAVEV